MSFTWKTKSTFEDGTPAPDPWQEINGSGVMITLERRPFYCDRGNFIAKVFTQGFAISIDDQDGWPRYYFDETRAKLEIEAWILKRGLELL